MNLPVCRALFVTLLLGMLPIVMPGAVVAPAAADPNPCAGVIDDPGPPIADPEPDIAGQVGDAAGGVSGATVNLYRCDDAVPVRVASTATGQDGGYAFAAVPSGHFYVVEVIQTGPLAGTHPAAGTANPSAPQGLGPSVSDLNFTFE